MNELYANLSQGLQIDIIMTIETSGNQAEGDALVMSIFLECQHLNKAQNASAVYFF